MAMIVWRVTPTRSASSAWVISPCAKRRRRMSFVTRVGRPIGLEAAAVGDQLDDRTDDGLRHEHEVHRVRDPEVGCLEHGQDEGPDHADAEDDAGHVLAEAADVTVAHVLAVRVAGPDHLDADATDVDPTTTTVDSRIGW